MKKKWYIAGAALLLGLLLAIFIIRSGPGGTDAPSDTPDLSEAGPDSSGSDAEEYRTVMTEDKSETVYAKADPEGAVYETSVEAMLKNPGGSGPIPDRSNLTSIKNTKGEEEYTSGEDGTILWDNLGQDISYKGTSDAPLPVSVRITYYLDGQPIHPEELAGKSGQVRIRFDYENLTSDTGYVPFAVCTALFLPSDVFYHIEVTNGKVISMDDQNMVVGYAFPGLQENLGLSGYEPTEEVEIPEYVELTADVQEFEMEFTATVVTNGLFEEMDLEDLDDVEEMIDDMKELTDASTELVDGTSELLDGVMELRDGIQEYTDGVEAVDEGIDAVKEGLDALDDQKTPLREGALALQNGLETLNAALAQISLPSGSSSPDTSSGENAPSPDGSDSSAPNMDTVMETLSDDLESLSGSIQSLRNTMDEEGTEIPEELKAMEETAAHIQAQLGSLKSYSESLSGSLTGLSALQSTLGTLKTSVAQLTEGSKQLSTGIEAYTKGVSQLYRGSLELSEGSSALTEANIELNDGLTELVDGVEELHDGFKEFDEEGIQNLADLAGDDLAAIIRQIRALKEADGRYQSFSGLLNGQTGSVRFIIETDEISF